MGGGSLRILSPSEENVLRCAEALASGELVVMPTETVYGLAADAMNPEAVSRVFSAKARPSDNPLIVHLGSQAGLSRVVSEIPESVERLAQAFWPGPLTLVLPKHRGVPESVTGGLDTVAVRVPNHPVALELLRASARPLCAPSANRFTALSPTRAEDVDRSLDAFAVLDGGPCAVGIESTVLDLTGGTPTILRPGAVTAGQISEVLGRTIDVAAGSKKSPGQYPKHYAPRTPVQLVERLASGQGGLTFGEAEGPFQIRMASEASAYAADLYARLHQLDLLGLDTIYIERPPQTAEWVAVWDRLQRAVGVP